MREGRWLRVAQGVFVGAPVGVRVGWGLLHGYGRAVVEVAVGILLIVVPVGLMFLGQWAWGRMRRERSEVGIEREL
jgi:hypothetical protein